MRPPILALAILTLTITPSLAGTAETLLDDSGWRGGLIVHLGPADDSLTVELFEAARARVGVNGRCLVHALVRDDATARSLGGNDRLLVETFDGRRLPYVDNLVNLLVVDDPGSITPAEILRVLCPDGVVMTRTDDGWTKTTKPRPADIDRWTHYLYDATNNAVSNDRRVGPPRHVRWRASPTFARHHDVLASTSAAVTDGRRIFAVMDDAPPSLMSLPPRWHLLARDADNGILLWKRPLATWDDGLRSFRAGPPQLARRLVVGNDGLYVTLGLNAPVTRVDAATGETLDTYADTERADEILVVDDVLLAVTFAPGVFEEQEQNARRGVPSSASPRGIVAVDTSTGKTLWSKSGDPTLRLKPTTLAAAAGRVVYQCDREIRCVKLSTGEDLWRQSIDRTPVAWDGKTGKAGRRGTTKGFQAPFYAPTLVLATDDTVVLSADSGRLVALEFDSGEILWDCPCTPDFHAPADVFVADGLVWAGLFGTEGRDVRTGKVQRTLDVEGLLTPGHHPRCYRNKATCRFVITDKRGLEFFDLTANEHSRNNWTRGTCQYGILPANGLIYLPPNSCCCYAGAMLHGFYALGPRQAKPVVRLPDDRRLQPGPAYDTADELVAETSTDAWPTLRGDGLRRGAVPFPIGVRPTLSWQVDLTDNEASPPKLTPPVVADGRLFLASSNAGRVFALDANSGKTLWTFDVSGRVDSPPTIQHRRVLFGSADGHVYALRADNGQLLWRFLAAATDRRIVVDESLESVWPVHGNILIHQDVAYFVAGRSCYLDGGLDLYGIDPATGKLLYHAHEVIADDRQTGAFIMPGVEPDVLVTDGRFIYLQQWKYDARLRRQPGFGRHLMAHSGLTDDSWFYRTFWRLGHGDAYDFPNSYIKHDLQVPFGQILVFNDRVVCGVQTHFLPGIVPSAVVDSSKGCLLFGDANTPFGPDESGRDYPRAVKRPKTPGAHRWTAKLPFQARAMLLADETLFVTGWPESEDPTDPYAGKSGRLGGHLQTFNATTGEQLSQQHLPARPVFDGMAATPGHLYMVTTAGKVLCFN